MEKENFINRKEVCAAVHLWELYTFLGGGGGGLRLRIFFILQDFGCKEKGKNIVSH